ncbi:MAG: NADH-quinone oxidoreductase subunit H, partial [Candidatus Omnitrophota bacterium]
FRITPFVILASTIAAASLVPVLASKISLYRMGDFLTIIFILALGRFFMCLAALDAGSAFGGMGSSREMFISSLVEPVALLSVFAVSMNASSTSIAVLSGVHAVRLSSIVAAISFFIVTIVETSRIPVDNKETHLELTMIHEAMVLEYSGPSLAMIELAAHVKQIVFFSILANVVLPWGMAGSLTGLQPAVGLAVYSLKIAGISLIIAMMEISMAKMRLFRVVDLLSFAIALSILAVIISAGGM